MNNTYPIGTPLTFVWRFQASDGTPIAFTSRYSFSLRYITGRGTDPIDTFFVSPDLDGITWTLPADKQRFVGNYGLVLDILLDGELLEHCYYRDAFSLYKTEGGPMQLTQNNRGEIIDLLTVGEFYHFMAGGVIYAGSTRPSTDKAVVGMMYFDTNLHRPIWVKDVGPSAVTWVDATGTEV